MRLNRSRFFEAYYVKEWLLGLAFLIFIFGFPYFERWMTYIWTDYKPSVVWAPLYELASDYILVVVVSSLSSMVIALSIGVLIHVYNLSELKALMMTIGDFGTTFPTIAVIALLVPVLGYGFKPVMAALIIYGLLPILTNTIEGLTVVDQATVLAARGMGMSTWQRLFKVEMPLAMPMILAGVRTSVIINIAAATVGSVVGAGGLGMPIVSGIRTNEPILILKGAIPVALLATLADRLFYRLERKYQW